MADVGIKYVSGETAQLASFAFGGTAKSFAPVNESADFYNFKQIQFALARHTSLPAPEVRHRQ